MNKNSLIPIKYITVCSNNLLNVGGGFLFSCVVNFGLETVIIPRRCLLRSSSMRRVLVDYYFYVEDGGCWCARVVDKLFLVASSWNYRMLPRSLKGKWSDHSARNADFIKDNTEGGKC